MFPETVIGNLRSSLSNKDSVIHKKALTIIDTILTSTHKQLQDHTEANSNLVILTLLYKQYKQTVEDQAHENSISCLILINSLLPYVNTASLQNAGVLLSMKQLTTRLLSVNNKNFLALRYCLSVLTELVIVGKAIDSEGNEEVVTTLLEIALKSVKSVERREAVKNLRIILDKYPTLGTQIANETKTMVDENTGDVVYVHSLKSLAGFFPSVLLNDICFKLKQYLRVEDDSYTEELAVEVYFFLDAIMEMQLVIGEIAEEILKELIHNIPLGGNHKITYGYLQCIHSGFLTLNRVNASTAQKYLSSVISVVSEMLLAGGKIPKQAEGILKEVIEEAVSPSLWESKNDLDIETLELEGGINNSFDKVVSMLQDLLSTRYSNKVGYVFGILREFFGKLDQSASTLTMNLLVELINERERFPRELFNQLFGAVISAFGHVYILGLVPVSMEGDPTAEDFEKRNNLWLLEIVSKHGPPGSFQVFISIMFPLLQRSQQLRINPQQNRLRQSIYHELSQRLWITLSNLYLSEPRLVGWEECIEYIESNLVDKYEQLPLVLNGFIQLLTHATINPQYFSTKAEKLIPSLAKMLDLQNEKQAASILKSITNLSKVCDPQYLSRVFVKNLTKLLTEKQAGTLIQNEGTNTKNIEILMAISHSVNFKDPSVTTLNGQQLSNIECTVELLRILLEEKNVFQKKAYKYMMQCFEYMPSSFVTEAKDLIDKEVEVLPSSRSYRLAVFHSLWEASGFSGESCNIEDALGFVKEYVPEVILMLKEPNHKVRKLAHSLLKKILATMSNFGIIESFLEMVSAGLANVSASGKVDAINALTLSLESLDVDSNAEFAKELTEVVSVLLQETKPQILKAVIHYLRKYIFLFPSSKNSLPDIMKSIFETDDSTRLNVLHLIKRLLLKLVKRDSKETILKIIPAQHQRLLKSMMREEGKKKREQRKRYLSRKEQQKQERHDSSDSEHEVKGRNDHQMETEDEPIDEKKVKNNMLLKYDLDQERFHFVDGKKKQAKAETKKREIEEDDDVAFINGKLVVKESGGKRKREQTLPEDEEKEQEQARAPRKIKKVGNEVVHQVKESGSSYKAARAKGDLRIKNKPEPHAFIQLNPKALNKRYKQKADKVFENFFEKKEGGLKGLKSRMLSKKK